MRGGVGGADGSAAGGGCGADGGGGLALAVALLVVTLVVASRWALLPRLPLPLLGLEGLAAHVVVLLPVLVLAEGAAVARRVAAATCLARLAPAVPATLRDGKGREGGGEEEKDRIQYEYLTVTKMK